MLSSSPSAYLRKTSSPTKTVRLGSTSRASLGWLHLQFIFKLLNMNGLFFVWSEIDREQYSRMTWLRFLDDVWQGKRPDKMLKNQALQVSE